MLVFSDTLPVPSVLFRSCRIVGGVICSVFAQSSEHRRACGRRCRSSVGSLTQHDRIGRIGNVSIVLFSVSDWDPHRGTHSGAWDLVDEAEVGGSGQVAPSLQRLSDALSCLQNFVSCVIATDVQFP